MLYKLPIWAFLRPHRHNGFLLLSHIKPSLKFWLRWQAKSSWRHFICVSFTNRYIHVSTRLWPCGIVHNICNHLTHKIYKTCYQLVWPTEGTLTKSAYWPVISDQFWWPYFQICHMVYLKLRASIFIQNYQPVLLYIYKVLQSLFNN